VCVCVCVCVNVTCKLFVCVCVCVCVNVTCKLFVCVLQVRGIVNTNLPEYKCLRARAKANKGCISMDDLLWVMSLMANTLTIHVTFGRPSLFQRLTVGHGQQAVAGRLCGSSNFKTWARWFVNSMFFCAGARSADRLRCILTCTYFYAHTLRDPRVVCACVCLTGNS